jgi:hypothetical protein
MGKKELKNISETLHNDSLNPEAMGLFPIFDSLFDSPVSLPTTKQKSLKNQKMNTSYNCTYCDKKFQQSGSQKRHERQCLTRKKSFKSQKNSNEYAGRNTLIEDENTPKKEENTSMKEKHSSKTLENSAKKSSKGQLISE